MAKFKLRPEIKEFKYWLHIFLIAIILQFILGKFGVYSGEISITSTLYFAGAIGISDVIVHSLLKLD